MGVKSPFCHPDGLGRGVFVNNIKKVLLIVIMVATTLIVTPAISTEAVAKAKVVTITVKKVDTATTKKVCDQAKKGKKFHLKIKGNKKKSFKQMEKLNKKLRKVNGWSLVVNPKKGKSKKGYTTYTVCKDKSQKYTVANLPNPIQTKTSGMDTFELDGYQVQIKYKYTYVINALVVSTHDYKGAQIADKLAPKDVALAWGKVAANNGSIDFHWRQSGRWYYWQAYEALEPVGGIDGVNFHSSNNHLIAENQSVKTAIKKIKTGDVIRLTGYLVNVNANNPDGSIFWWNSSTTRKDSGDGACEVIYVTDVERLN